MAASAKKKPKGLGRGLDALLGVEPKATPPNAPAPAEAAEAPGPRRELPIEFLAPNPDQPRREFDAAAIEELARSIAARGMLQPILVRPVGKDAFEIVAGERRWRAAQKAKLHKVPVIIRELSDQDTAEIALIENVQRVDLSPLEEAEAYHRLTERYKRSQEEIAKAVGKSRSHVANIMRLTTLPDAAKSALASGKITMGHARALLALPDPAAACARVIREGLSVRQVEAMARKDGPTPSDPTAKSKPAATKSKGSGDADTRALERDLAAILGLEVSIDHDKSGSGAISVQYTNLDQLDDLCRRLMGAGV